MPKTFSLLILLVALGSLSAAAQAPGGDYAHVAASVAPAAVKHGGQADLAITVNIASSFHINSAKPGDPDLIPTKLTLAKASGLAFGPIRYPASKTVRESYSPKPMLVYMGKATIHVPVTVVASAKPGRHTIQGTLVYQGCNATSCFPPQSVPVKETLTVK